MIFLYYFIFSGVVCSIFVYFQYDSLVKAMPILGMFDRQTIILIQFFTGFFQFPIMIFYIPSILYLQWKIKKSQKKTKEIEERNKKLKEQIYKLEEQTKNN